MAVLLQARSGIARSGATRSGYLNPVNAIITINGVNRTNSIEVGSLRVHTGVHDDQDTASFDIKPSAGYLPAVRQLVTIALGGSNTTEFGGQIVRLTERYDVGFQTRPTLQVECVGWDRLFNRRKINYYWSGTSATQIVLDILALFTSGFTGNAVETGLPTIESFPCTEEEPLTALARLAHLLGGSSGSYIDATRDLHFFGAGGETGIYAGSNPVTLTNALRTLEQFSYTQDVTQQRTRIRGRGWGTQLSANVAAGMTAIPVESTAFHQDILNAIHIQDYGVVNTVGFYTDAGVGFYVANLVNDATPGVTSITVTDVTVLPNSVMWYHLPDSDVYFYSTGVTHTGPGTQGTIDGIPASGYGSITSTIYGPEWWVAAVPVFLLPTALAGPLLKGVAVNDYTIVDDTVEQALTAAAEGGDGIHEVSIVDERLNSNGMTERALAELAVFAPPLEALAWTTRDLNAKRGRTQQISYTVGTRTITTTVQILATDLEFFENNRTAPRRTCRGGMLVIDNLE